MKNGSYDVCERLRAVFHFIYILFRLCVTSFMYHYFVYESS